MCFTVLTMEEAAVKFEVNKKEIFTIPNILSTFRVFIAFLFFFNFERNAMENRMYILTFLVILSALTDFLDGKIARKFHMVSELGKILDPLADKISQGILIICLLSKYKIMKALLFLFIIKEIYMVTVGAMVLKKTKKNTGAMWYGKTSTAVFYIVILLLMFMPNVSESVANILIFISGFFMMLSFVLYYKRYRALLKT